MTTPLPDPLATAYRYTGTQDQIYPGYLKIVPADEGETTGPITLIGHAGSDYRYHIASADQGVDYVYDDQGNLVLDEDGNPVTTPRPPLPVPPPDGNWEEWPPDQPAAQLAEQQAEPSLMAAAEPPAPKTRTSRKAEG